MSSSYTECTMQCKSTAIGVSGPVNSETIGEGAVEKEPSLYSLVSQ